MPARITGCRNDWQAIFNAFATFPLARACVQLKQDYSGESEELLLLHVAPVPGPSEDGARMMMRMMAVGFLSTGKQCCLLLSQDELARVNLI